MMKVEFYSSLRQIAGEKVIEIQRIQPLTVYQLLEQIAARYPLMQRIFFDVQGYVYDSLPLFVNGRNPRLHSSGLDLLLTSQDVVSIFTPIASGRLNVEVLKKAQVNAQGSEQ